MESLLKSIYKNRKLAKALRLVSHSAGIYAFFLFLYVCAHNLFISPMSSLKLCIILGSSYIAVSLVRKFIDAPRPYELYEFFDSAPKNKKGHSFPSRHTFLVFAIATLCAPFALIPALVLYLLALFLALSRVLLGIHFIRDVLAGALLGFVCSAIGLLIFRPF